MTKEQVEMLCDAILRISYGDNKNPMGMEAITLALAGKPFEDSVSSGLHDIAAAIRELAESIRERNHED